MTATTMGEVVRRVIGRELAALRREILAYPDDASVWALPPGMPNAAGTLALHVAGNLRHFVGARIGGMGYRRDRDAEFARRDVPRAEIVAELDAAAADLAALDALPDSALGDAFDAAPGDITLPTRALLVHLATHLAYHLGQVDYHRRAVTGGGGVGALRSTDIFPAR